MSITNARFEILEVFRIYYIIGIDDSYTIQANLNTHKPPNYCLLPNTLENSTSGIPDGLM